MKARFCSPMLALGAVEHARSISWPDGVEVERKPSLSFASFCFACL